MKVLEDQQLIHITDGPIEPKAIIEQMVSSNLQEDPFYVMDLGEVVNRYHKWKEAMPRVEPFYAIKCNSEKVLVSTLAALGTGFDCASKAEMDLVTSIGVRPERIIFAHPAKMASQIRHAASIGVNVMTFDSEIELMKIQKINPNAQLVVRIRCDASDAQCQLGLKFGCDPITEAPKLIKLAALMNMDIIGVSFHVGSGSRDFTIYSEAIRLSRSLFDLADRIGLPAMTLLDIGGGFPGHTESSIDEAADIINEALSKYFPSKEVRVIAEPGRYFAAAAYTLATMVHAKRQIQAKDPSEIPHTMYFINDGVYGSFNCCIYDHQVVVPEAIDPSKKKEDNCSLWGPSCDGFDCLFHLTSLPSLEIGEWLIFRNMGAYTIPIASPFNGFPVPKVCVLVTRSVWNMLKDIWPIRAPISFEERPPSPLTLSPPIMPEPLYVECAIK